MKIATPSLLILSWLAWQAPQALATAVDPVTFVYRGYGFTNSISGPFGTGLNTGSSGLCPSFPNGDGSYSFVATGRSTALGSLGLGLTYGSAGCSGQIGSNINSAQFSLGYRDSIVLVAPSGASLPASLTINYVLDGKLSAHRLGTSGCADCTSAQAMIEVIGAGETFSSVVRNNAEIVYGSGSVSNPPIAFAVNAPNGGDDTYDFGLSMIATVDGNHGSAEASFAETLSLVSVLLPDGSTPESRDFSLAFASGIPSPNTVPVPAPLPLLGLGPFLGWARVMRRRARAVADRCG